MALHCSLITISRYAAIDTNDCLTIACVMNAVSVRARPIGVATEPPVLALPPLFLTAVCSASLADGLHHEFGVGLRHEDGSWVVPAVTIGALNFKLNDRGRPMRAQIVVELAGMMIPASGDYELVIFANGQELAAAALYVEITVESAS